MSRSLKWRLIEAQNALHEHPVSSGRHPTSAVTGKVRNGWSLASVPARLCRAVRRSLLASCRGCKVEGFASQRT